MPINDFYDYKLIPQKYYLYPSEKKDSIVLSKEVLDEFNKIKHHYCCCSGYNYMTGEFIADKYISVIKYISGIDIIKKLSPEDISIIYKGLRELIDTVSSPESTKYYLNKYCDKTTNHLIHLSNHYPEIKDASEYIISIGELIFLYSLFYIYVKYNMFLHIKINI